MSPRHRRHKAHCRRRRPGCPKSETRQARPTRAETLSPPPVLWARLRLKPQPDNKAMPAETFSPPPAPRAKLRESVQPVSDTAPGETFSPPPLPAELREKLHPDRKTVPASTLSPPLCCRPCFPRTCRR